MNITKEIEDMIIKINHDSLNKGIAIGIQEGKNKMVIAIANCIKEMDSEFDLLKLVTVMKQELNN